MRQLDSENITITSSTRLLLVDLCGTLYDSNTTFDFLRHFLSGNELYARFDERNAAFLRRLFNRAMPGDPRRSSAVAFLKGFHRDRLVEAASIFLQETPVIADVHQYVKGIARDYDNTFIISSSLDFIVEAACRILDFDGFRASRLDYDDGICTGVIGGDLMGAKHKLIAAEFGAAQCTLVTDNRDDAQCRAVVKRLIGVAAGGDRRANQFWSRNADEVLTYGR